MYVPSLPEWCLMFFEQTKEYSKIVPEFLVSKKYLKFYCTLCNRVNLSWKGIAHHLRRKHGDLYKQIYNCAMEQKVPVAEVALNFGLVSTLTDITLLSRSKGGSIDISVIGVLPLEFREDESTVLAVVLYKINNHVVAKVQVFDRDAYFIVKEKLYGGLYF